MSSRRDESRPLLTINEILVGGNGFRMSGGQLMSQSAQFSNVRRRIYTERVFSFISQYAVSIQ